MEYDPAQAPMKNCWNCSGAIHDPTTPNRRSGRRDPVPFSGFYHSQEQKAAAEVSKEKLQKSGRYKKPVVTEITPAPVPLSSREYHQQYFEKRGISGHQQGRQQAIVSALLASLIFDNCGGS